MTISEVKAEERTTSRWGVPMLFSFFAIYFIWGSTYLAIRVVVETVPPLFAAGVRFAIAGLALFVWSRLRGISAPSRLEWRNLAILGATMFLLAYGGLFWAEKTVPSGIASVLVATIPVWTALFEIFVFRRETLRLPLMIAILTGLIGVVTLAGASGTGHLNLLACLAVLGAEISWSFGTVLSKGMQLPASKIMSAGCQMLLGGGMLLLASALAGEMHPWPRISPRAGLALAYLIVAGSLIAFTAYMWLLGRLPATQVASYAYVNPVIALAIGYWLAGEALTARTLLGTALVLASVFLLLGDFSRKTRKVP